MSTDADQPAAKPHDLAVLTTVPVAALGQPLVDFLAPHGVAAFVADDETGLDASRVVEVMVAEKDLERAKALLQDFWAENEGPRDEM
ncbi:MAG: DUF2007 domain-containing protein [Deltaproteobacteria bacterium]|nr:DUF2007 domain-containing protein [Deltaproteobacteria bacterium]